MSKKIILSVLMITIIIEAMGQGLVLPLLPSLLASSLSPFSITPSHYFLYYGLSIALWPLGFFFGTPYLCTLSDSLGRKKVLMICLLGNGLFYALTIFSIYGHLLWFFLLLRFFSGFICSSYEIAQASAADISSKEERGKVMGLIGFAFCIGLILGPLITSFSGHAVTSLYSFSLPFGIAAALSFINGAFLYYTFQETYTFIKKGSVFSFQKLFGSLLFIYKDSRVRNLGITYFLFQIGWNIHFQYIPLFLKEMFSFTVTNNAFFFLMISCAYACTFLIQNFLSKCFSLHRLSIVANIVSGIALIVTTIASYPLQWFLGSLISICIMIGYSSLLALLSTAVSEQEQGKIMGNLGALGSITNLIAASCIGLLSYVSLLLPFYIASLAFLAGGLYLFYFCTERDPENIGL
jgi:MFS family permease